MYFDSLNLITLLSRFLIVFCIGSITGWVLEFIYRNRRPGQVSLKGFLNPGFLGGPYLPIYGFGAFLVFQLASSGLNMWLTLFVFTLLATLFEYLTGLFFFKIYHLRLWDYSQEWANVQGYICPRYSFYWFIVGLAALKLLFPLLDIVVKWLDANIHYTFFLGFYYGIFFGDIVNSFNIAGKLSSLLRVLKTKDLPHILNYGHFSMHLRQAEKILRERRSITRFVLPFGNLNKREMEDHLYHFFDKLKKKPTLVLGKKGK